MNQMLRHAGKRFAILATMMMLMGPATPALAEQAKAKPEANATVINDVALTEAGTLNGTVIGKDAKPMVDATVKLLRNGKVVAEEQTSQQGTFHISHAVPGLYVVQVEDLASVMRVWDHKVAPPKAKSELLLIQDSPVVRGQLGAFTLFNTVLLGTAVTSAVLAGINLGKINDLEDKIDALPSSP